MSRRRAPDVSASPPASSSSSSSPPPRPLVLVLHGPNLNLLGTREPDVYGTATLADVDARVAARAARLGLAVECFQSNHEGALIDHLHACRARARGVVINAGAYAHTSVALRDALAAVALPAIEVHLTNTLAREPFRHASLLGAACVGRIEGLGALGYELALEALAARIRVAKVAPSARSMTPRVKRTKP